MKFGKSLSSQIDETLPEWRDKFLSYKELKKRLKLIEPKPVDVDDDARPAKRPRLAAPPPPPPQAADDMSSEEISFIQLLEDELEKFNSFFVEKEEEYIIRLKEIQDDVAIARAKHSTEEVIKIRKEIVDFHGEMVLLENYSALNYTGLVKILKKYDKRTGALMRLPFIQRVLQQPFFTTDLLYKLVKECESTLDQLFAMCEPPTLNEGSQTDGPSISGATESDGISKVNKELAEIEYIESLYMKSTISALRALKEIRSGSSTVSAFSLPPLQSSGLEEDAWKKVPVLEQLAK